MCGEYADLSVPQGDVGWHCEASVLVSVAVPPRPHLVQQYVGRLERGCGSSWAQPRLQQPCSGASPRGRSLPQAPSGVCRGLRFLDPYSCSALIENFGININKKGKGRLLLLVLLPTYHFRSQFMASFGQSDGQDFGGIVWECAIPRGQAHAPQCPARLGDNFQCFHLPTLL